MDITVLRNLIHEKLVQGLLPGAMPERTSVGPGAGYLCDGCGLSITAAELEYVLDFLNGLIVRFHSVCDVLWRIEASL